MTSIMKKTFLLAALAMLSLGASAQKGEKGPFITGKAFDNWFISAGGGANIYFGEFDSEAKLGKRLAPALDVSLGKWFTPEVGARLQYSGLSAKGATVAGARFAGSDVVGNSYLSEKFNVNFVHADFLWNISSAIGGQRSDRFWEFIPFTGFGAAFASDNDHKDAELAFTAGLTNKIRVTDALSVNLEMRGMMVNQRFEGTSGGTKLEGMGATTLGLTYKFGKKRKFEKHEYAAPVDYTPYNNRIETLRAELADANKKIEKLTYDLNEAKRDVGTTTTVKPRVEIPKTYIFFRLNSHVISDQAHVSIDNLAKTLKEMSPARKFKVIGSADRATGSEKYNMELSRKRAQAVRDALVAKGVDASKLEVIALGGANEPLDKNKPMLDRHVVVVE